MKSTIGKCSVWIYGSVMGSAGWIEGKILEVGEGFKNQREAKSWAEKAMKRLDVPGKSSTHKYKIGPAY
jgi:hypothetical protein